jgi:hypothetical protein
MKRGAFVILCVLALLPMCWGAMPLPTNRATIIDIGPLVDYSDGVTPITAMTATNVTICLIKRSDAGGSGTAPSLVINTTATASGGANDLVHVTGDTVGFWQLELTASQLNFLGCGRLTLSDPDVICPWWVDIVVEPNNVYNSQVSGTDTQQVDVTQMYGLDPNLSLRHAIFEAPIADWDDVADTFGAEFVLASDLADVTDPLAANMTQIGGHSIIGTGTLVADGFEAMFNVASPVFTLACLNQTGDTYALANGESGFAALVEDVGAIDTSAMAEAVLAETVPGTSITLATLLKILMLK